MPTLFGRRYVRGVKGVGRTERVLGLVFLLLVVTVVAAFVVHVATSDEYLFDVGPQVYTAAMPAREAGNVEPGGVSEPEMSNPFPDSGLSGWKLIEPVERFTPDDLYIKIDGRAAAYLHYGFVELVFGMYAHQSDGERTADVYWYDMGEPANALAMYQSERPPDITPIALGHEGYQVGGAVFFCKGSSYVQLLPSRLDDADARAALRIAERVAERIDEP